MPQKASSATMLVNLRDGDVAEYLAQFILSSLGSSILTPRPEDHGFDFHCTINSAKRGREADFRDSFYLQAKLGNPKAIEVGGKKKNGIWRKDRIHRVLNMDIPMLIGFVDINRHDITIFQTSSRWLLYYSTVTESYPFKIVFRPSSSISMPSSTKARGVEPTKTHDGKRWVVDLGPPLLRIRLSDLQNTKTISRIKRTLARYIQMERINAAHRIFCTQWATWISYPPRGAKLYRTAWVLEEGKFPYRDAIFYREFGRFLTSLILRLRVRNQLVALGEASAIYRRLKRRFIIPIPLRQVIEEALI